MTLSKTSMKALVSILDKAGIPVVATERGPYVVAERFHLYPNGYWNAIDRSVAGRTLAGLIEAVKGGTV